MSIIENIKNKDDLITGRPVGLDIIEEAEKKLKLRFSVDYKEYLSEFGFAVFEEHELTGICNGKRLDVVKNTLEERECNRFLSNEWYVIECLGIDGVVIWQNEKGEIIQTTPDGSINKICDSLCEYIED